jgi:hypothetical protein
MFGLVPRWCSTGLQILLEKAERKGSGPERGWYRRTDLTCGLIVARAFKLLTGLNFHHLKKNRQDFPKSIFWLTLANKLDG